MCETNRIQLRKKARQEKARKRFVQERNKDRPGRYVVRIISKTHKLECWYFKHISPHIKVC